MSAKDIPSAVYDKPAAPGLDDFVKIHPEAQRNYRGLQQKSREILAVGGKGMSNTQTENNADGQGDGWRNIATGGNDQAGKEKRLDD